MRNGLSNDLRALSPKSCSQPTVVIILEMAMIALIGTNAVMITMIMLTALYMAGLSISVKIIDDNENKQ